MYNVNLTVKITLSMTTAVRGSPMPTGAITRTLSTTMACRNDIFYQKSTDKYCRERKVSGKRVYEELVPQPEPESIITLTRYYNVLKADANYRRHVTWMMSSSIVSPVAVIEYIGQHVAGAAHGNCRKPDECEKYVRTPTETMTTIDNLTKQMPPKAAYTKPVSELGVLDTPRDSNVMHAKKSRSAKASKPSGMCANFADEWLTVYNLMSTDTFIIFVGALHSKVPNIILYDCNLLLRFDSGPSPRPPLHRGGYHLVDRTGSGRNPRETNPAQRKANFPLAVSGSYCAEDCRQTNVRLLEERSGKLLLLTKLKKRSPTIYSLYTDRNGKHSLFLSIGGKYIDLSLIHI